MGKGEESVSIPVRLLFDWDKIKVCEECGRKLAQELLKYVRMGNANIDIAKILCDECWRYNIDNGGIRAEIDPKVIRK